MLAGLLRHRDRLLTFVAFALPCLYFAVTLRYPPVVGGDLLFGFEVWDAMGRGACWNCALHPDPNDLARDLPQFVTWWSPAQYLVPGALEWLGLSTGHAISVALLLSSLIGLFGCQRLYRQLDFSPFVTACSLLVIVTGWHFTGQFRRLTGAEPILLAAAPWVIAAVLQPAVFAFRHLLLFWALFLLASFIKLSASVMCLALVATTWLQLLLVRTRPALVRAVGTSAAFLLAYAALYLTFLRFGGTPLGATEAKLAPLHAVLVASTFTVANVFAFGSLLGRVLYPDWFQDVAVLLPLSAALWFCSWRALRQHNSALYSCAAVAFAGTYTVVYAWFYLRGSAVGLEDRLFRPSGLILLPGLIALIAAPGHAWSKRALAGVLALLLLSACGYGLATYAVRVAEIRARGLTSARGFTQDFEIHPVSAEVLAALSRLDRELPPGNTLIATPLRLETPRHRSLPLYPLGPQPVATLRGRTGRVIVVVPAHESAGGRVSPHVAAFRDYAPHEWAVSHLDKWDIFFTGAPVPGLLSPGESVGSAGARAP